MILPTFLLSVLPLASAATFDRKSNLPRGSSFRASSYAGEATSAVFPDPHASNTGPAFNSFFPTYTQFAGPTPTGDEAAEIATATSVPKFEVPYPLVNPNGPDKTPIIRKWGNLSPWYSVDSFGLPDATEAIPGGCEIDQVHLLHRHGARYPAAGQAIGAFGDKLHGAVVNGTGFTATGKMAFLNTWTNKLGAEILTPFGRQQLFNLGTAFRIKYGELLKKAPNLPVFRTTSQDRMLKSALNFAAGFFGVPQYQTDYHEEIIPEEPGWNNTLAPETCIGAFGPAGDFGETASVMWADKYLTPTVKRLQPQIQGINLTTTDAYNMQLACAYETVALGSSAFCDLFTEEEWEGFDYASDLFFWYTAGPGSPYAAALGMGWVEEFVSRVTRTPITVARTSTNTTLTSNPTTFPLDQAIYVDASHDTVISTILVALNLTSFTKSGPLPLDHVPKDRSYKVHEIAPFATHLTGQILTCPSRVQHSQSSKFVRWILNDGVVPVSNIPGCGNDKDGLCPLDAFISAMRQQIDETDWNHVCNGNITLPQPDNITNGRPVN